LCGTAAFGPRKSTLRVTPVTLAFSWAVLALDMSILYWREPEPPTHRPPTTAFYVGLALYALSFLLPAVNNGFQNIPGWVCAGFSAPLALGVGATPLFFLGFLNPLAIIYAGLRLYDRAVRVRIALVIAIMICILLTWVFLLILQFGIRIGHIAWIAGLLLIIDWKDLSFAG
jgi:hypothetical protein